MKPPFATWKSVVLTFLLASIFYVVAYVWMSRRQTGQGPWEVTFTTNAVGTPQLILAEAALGISNVTIHFPGEQLAASNTTGVVAFAKPKMPTPFCRVVYDDLMFQPGVITLDCFGHLVEMAPRALGLNGSALPWTNDTVRILSGTNKMSEDARKKLKGGYRR